MPPPLPFNDGKKLFVPIMAYKKWAVFIIVPYPSSFGEHWTLIQKYSHQADIVVGLLLVAGAGWFIRSRLATGHARRGAKYGRGEK
jgi:hypothetical protein